MPIALPAAFRFAGATVGIKKSGRPDFALIVSDRPAAAVGMFTTNRVCAAPVQVCRERLPSSQARAILINSGNANACTGEQGKADAVEMTRLVANQINAAPEHVLVCSTGVIGRPLPMEVIRAGVASIVPMLGTDVPSFEAAATGILTTDTRMKTAARTLSTPAGEIRIVGFAKGAAMIGPNMATMLAFILTDADAQPDELRPILQQAVDRSFPAISVEGHTSTNDSIILLANGGSGASVAGVGPAFALAIEEVAQELAIAIVDDGEEVTHRVTIDVVGTRTEQEARRIAKEVANSALVKTAIFGNDPNWGRICSAAGYAGVEFDERDLSLRVNGTLLYDRGMPTPFDGATESQRMKDHREVHVELTLTLGSARCRFWTTDLTVGYVRFNAEYTT
jgi:glutamate N-acetyltransferase/amino-acid N-acetyltransferase